MILSSTAISFPAMKITLDPPTGIHLSENFSIQFYGIIIAIGLLLAVSYGLKRSRQFGLREDDILDGVLWIVPFAIICARLYYCIFEWDAYKENPISMLYIWKGGLAIYGGVIGATVGIVIFSLIKKVRLSAVLDLVAISFLIGQFIGRWGNFFNREAFGAYCDSFLAMQINKTYLSIPNVPTPQFQEALQLLKSNAVTVGADTFYLVHPTFLYESAWNLVGFIALHFLSKKRQYDGQMALGYVAWYGLGRTFIEGLRMDSLYWGQLRVSQVLAAATCFLAVAVLIVLAFFKHDRAKLYGNVMAETLDAEAEEAEKAKQKKKRKCRCKKSEEDEEETEEEESEEEESEETETEEETEVDEVEEESDEATEDK